MGERPDHAPLEFESVAEITIVCLANSWRPPSGNRCIAGVDDDGDWIRPVSPTGDGSLSFLERRVPPSREPALLERIRIPVIRPAPEPHQPENWIIGERSWQSEGHLAGRAAEELLDELRDDSPSIFGDTEQYRALSELPRQGIDHSLAVVAPPDLTWTLDRWDNGSLHPRAVFHLGKQYWDLPVTDPATKSLLQAAGVGHHDLNIRGTLPARRVFLTLSLAGPKPNTDRCFKLVAGVVPVP